MGLGRRTMGIGSDLNPNVKGDASVKMFTVSAGLDVQGFTQSLSGLVSHGHELAKLSISEWAQILGPMELAGERAARVQKAIGELRTKAAQEAAESDEKSSSAAPAGACLSRCCFCGSLRRGWRRCWRGW